MKRMKKSDEYYKKIFDKNMREGVDIYNSKGELLELLEDEEYRQVYDADDPARAVLPYSWFVGSKTGNVISVKDNGTLIWLLKTTDEGGYIKYKFRHPETQKIKVINAQNLIALTFGSKRFGKAKEYLEEKNLYAFGTKEDEDAVNGHHIKTLRDFPEEQFDSNNIELLTVRAHNLLHKFPAEDATLEEKTQFIKELNELAELEAPGKIVIVTGGDAKEIIDLDTFSLKQPLGEKNQFIGILNALRFLTINEE